jgi:autotransporter-associated beta strand protein
MTRNDRSAEALYTPRPNFKTVRRQSQLARRRLNNACASITAGAAALAAFAAVAGLTRSAQAADSPDNVNLNATDLGSGASYSGGAPGTGNDTTFVNGTYGSPGSFTLTSGNLTTGTLDDLDSTQALTISDATGNSIILSTLANSTPGAAVADLLYVANGGNLTIGDSVVLGVAGGNFDIAGTGAADISGVISDGGLGFGFVKTGAGTLTFNGSAANTYTGNTAVNVGALNLNYTNFTGNNLIAGGNLSLGGASLTVVGNLNGSTSQTFASTLFSSGNNIISVGTNNPTLAIGTIGNNNTAGSTVEFVGPATITSGNASFTATGTINSSTSGSSVQNYLLTTSGGTAYATVGLYDWAATTSTAVNGNYTIEGGSQVTNFYTTLSSGIVSGNDQNIDVTGASVFSNGSHTMTADTLRFNTNIASTFNINQTRNFNVGGILVTPNVGANNVTFDHNPGEGAGNGLNNGYATSLAIFQNNTSGELIFAGASGSGSMIGGTGAYIQSGPGTVFLDSIPDGDHYTGATYLNGGVTEIAAVTLGTGDPGGTDGQLGATETSNVNLNGGTLVGDYTGNLDGNGSASTAHPVVLGNNGGGLGAVSGTTLTVDGAVSGPAGTGPLIIGIPATNGSNGAPNNGNVTGQLPGTGPNTANSGANTVLATGTVKLTGANSYTGGTVIDSGTLLYNGTQATLGSSSGAMTVNTGGTLNLGASQSLAAGAVLLGGGTISGTGTSALTGTSFTSTGGSVSAILAGSGVPFTNVSGTTTLSGVNTYNGGTTVNGGTLNVTGAIGASAVTINSGGTVQGGAGATLGSTLSNSAGGGALTLAAATGNLTVTGPVTLGDNLAYASGNYTNLNYTLGGSNAVEKLIDSNTLTVGSGGAYVDISNPTQAGTFTLASYTSVSGGANFSLSPTTAGVTSQNAGRDTDTLTVNGGTLVLTVSGLVPSVAYWDGAVSSTWSDTSSNANYVNWSSNSAGTTDAGNVPGASTDVFLNATGSPSGSPAAGAAPSGSTQPMSLGGLTIVNSLTVNGEGTDTISNTGGYTLQINAVGDAHITAGNAITVGAAANAFTINAPVVMGGSGGNQTWTNASANTFTLGGNVTGTAPASSTQTLTLADTNTGGTTISGVISDTSTGSAALTAVVVNDTGTGVTTLGAANTYTGGTTLTAGNLTLGNAAALSTGTVTLNGGTLNLATYSPTITNLQGAASSTIGATGPVTLTVNGGNFSGNITDGTGTVALTSTGNLTLAGTNTNSGQTTVGSGTLVFVGSSAMSPNSAQLNLNGGTLSLLSDSNATFATPSFVPASASTFTLNVGAISTGSGNSLTLSSTNAVTVGGNTNQAMTINVTGANSDNLILNVGGNGLVFYPFGGVSLVLNPTTANLTVASNVVSGSAGVGALSLGGTSSNNIVSGNITNAGGTVLVNKSGNSTWTLSGDNTYTGVTTISAGTLFANNATSSLGTGAVSVKGGRLSGSGTINNGNNTITLAANSTATIAAGGNATAYGQLNTGAQVWNGNGTSYVWKIQSPGVAGAAQGSGASGTLGGAPGPGQGNDEGVNWDLLNITTGNLTLSSLSTSSQFTISPVGSITSTGTYSWVILQSAGQNSIIGVPTNTDLSSGAAPGVFVLNTAGFTDSNNPSVSASNFTLEAENFSNTEDLVLDYSYSAAPEPGAAMLVLAGGLPMLMARRRRRNGNAATAK